MPRTAAGLVLMAPAAHITCVKLKGDYREAGGDKNRSYWGNHTIPKSGLGLSTRREVVKHVPAEQAGMR